MGNDRRARRRERARKFGARHPRVSLVIVGALLVGVIAICGFQLSYGTYLGRGWWIAALAGMAAIAANGKVTWLPRNGDAEVDLTAACQALPPRPAASRRRRPRTTTLATASGPAEVDVSPRAIAELVRVLHRSPHGDTAHSVAQD